MQNIVVVKDLHHSFGELHVLQGVNIEVKKQEVVVILGPSGSGKSTFLRCVNLLVNPDKGRVWVDGEEITDPDADVARIRSTVGMVFQQFNLFPHMDAIGNVMEGLVTVLGKSKDEARELALDELKKVGLEDKLSAFPNNLSGGQQQRLAIARALAMKPKVMLFDEPTSALDPELIAEVLDAMKDMADQGMTMLVVTHELDFAKRVGQRICMFDEGTFIEEGDPEEFFSRPKVERTRKFLRQITWETDS